MQNNKSLQLAMIHQEVFHKPEIALEFMGTIIDSLRLYKEKTDKRNSNIWLIVKNLKPEYLAELKKLVVPEVFTSLGLD